MKPFMKIEEVAELLDLDYKTIYRLVLSGQLPASKIGAQYRIRQEDLEQFLNSQRTCAGGIESKAGGSGAGSCARCGLIFRVPSLVAGKCQQPDCDAPLCTNCWANENDRFCCEHLRVEVGPSLQEAQESFQKGDLPVLVKADAARQFEITFISRFDQAIGKQTAVVSPVDARTVRVSDWPSLHWEEAGLLPTDTGTSVVRRDRSTRSQPRNATTFYYVDRGAKAGFALGAACFSHIDAYSRKGFDVALTTRDELLQIVDNALALARRNATLLVLGIASTSGWDNEATEVVIGSATTKSFSHASLSLVLVDLFQNSFKFNPADKRLSPFVNFYVGEMEEETLARATKSVRDALLLREGLSLSEAVRATGLSESVMLKAFSLLASEGGYRLEWINGLGNVISKN